MLFGPNTTPIEDATLEILYDEDVEVDDGDEEYEEDESEQDD